MTASIENNKRLTMHDIAQMLDLSAVKAEQGPEDVVNLATAAKLINCKAVFVLPCYSSMLRNILHDRPGIIVGGAVGFPSGASTTTMKVAETRELIANGAGEIDMVACIGMVRAKRDQYVREDIQAVIEAAQGIQVKVIIEAHYLEEEEIIRASLIAAEAGAQYVKTGTGWPATGATLKNIALIKKTVRNMCGVKAAGGVKDLETLLQMYHCGATRFGVNLRTGLAIKYQIEEQPGHGVDIGAFVPT